MDDSRAGGHDAVLRDMDSGTFATMVANQGGENSGGNTGGMENGITGASASRAGADTDMTLGVVLEFRGADSAGLRGGELKDHGTNAVAVIHDTPQEDTDMELCSGAMGDHGAPAVCGSTGSCNIIDQNALRDTSKMVHDAVRESRDVMRVGSCDTEATDLGSGEGAGIRDTEVGD